MRWRNLTMVGLLLLVAACGSEDESTGVASLDDAVTTTTTPDAEVDLEDAMLAFTECLREQGLEVDDPTFDGEGGFGFRLGAGQGAPGGADDTTREAMEVCRPLMEGVVGQFDQPDLEALSDQMYAFAECMRDQGLDWPDPDVTAIGPGGGGGGGGGPFGATDVDMADPAVQAALEVCQTEFGGGGPLRIGQPQGPGGGAARPGDGGNG